MLSYSIHYTGEKLQQRDIRVDWNQLLIHRVSSEDTDDSGFKIVAAKNDDEDDHLNSYSVSDNGDNTYDVNFTVDASIEVDFTQDEETGEYLIHLEPGSGTQTEYAVTFNREEGENLQILFRNYYPSEDGRSTTSSRDKPRVIFD